MPQIEKPDHIRVKAEVEKAFGLKEGDIMNRYRYRPIPEARFVAMYILHCYCGYTQHQVGAMFGKDHATVNYGKQYCIDQLPINKDFRLLFIDLCHRLNIGWITINKLINGQKS